MELEAEVLSEEEKRENRRKRRVRSQRLAYLGLFLFIFIIIGAIVAGVVFSGKYLKNKKQRTEESVGTEQLGENLEVEEEIILEITEQENEIVTPEETLQEVLDEVVESVISEMTLEEKVAGLFIVTPEGITGVDVAVQAGDGTKKALEKYPVGGLIYFKKNIKSESQIQEMIEKSKEYSKYPLFVAVDEEGGEVSFLAENLKLENVGNMSDIGSTKDVSKAYEAMKNVGTYMVNYGFNLNFAPVADVAINADNSSLGDRSFGSDALVVGEMVTSAVNGLEEMGVTACVKHFPGMGDIAADTHNGLVVVDKSMEELKETELVPFISAIEGGANMIMVGHICLPQIVGDNTPATMSKEVISDLLRAELGFNGVVITETMDDSAITEYYGADEAAIRAFKAGADMVLMPENFELAYNGVIEAVKTGTISEERINDSLKRVYRIKYADSVGE